MGIEREQPAAYGRVQSRGRQESTEHGQETGRTMRGGKGRGMEGGQEKTKERTNKAQGRVVWE